MIKQFYEKVLPSKGTYCIAEISKEGRVKHHYTESIAKIEPIIEDIKSQRDTNIYVAPGSFNKTRLAKNSLYFKCIFIDVDVGDKKDYKTKEEAGEALDKFIEESELPRPIRVDSGNGYHAYWCLDRDITKEEYLIYSKKLADYCNEKGLKNDPAVMKDTARIMRCPDTHNYKSDPPKHCIVMDEDIGTYTIEEIQAVLGEVQPSLEDILNQAMSPFEHPLGWVLDTLFPSITRPAIEYAINLNAFGQNIYSPLQTRKYGGAFGGSDDIPELYKDTSRFLAEISGGYINWGPNTISFFANNYGDAIARVAHDLYGISLFLRGQKEFDFKRDTIFFDSFISKYSRIEQRDYSKQVERLKALGTRIDLFKDANPIEYNKILAKYPSVPVLIDAYNEQKADLDKLNNQAATIRRMPGLSQKEREARLQGIKELQLLYKKNIAAMIEVGLEQYD